MKISRRQFLKLSAAIATASAIGLELPLPKELEAANIDADKWVKTVCRYCGSGCGVYVGVTKGKVVAIKSVLKDIICLQSFTRLTGQNIPC